MLEVGNVLISFDVLQKEFCCNLKACKGDCCIEGDAGAPVTPEEIDKIEQLLPVIWNDLSNEAKAKIEADGVAYLDPEGELVTSIVNGKDCVFTCYGEDGCCYCAIEKAFREGRCSFMKPISCHLYPIRVSKIGDYWALNYNKWDICQSALVKGHREGIPLYKYLKEPLTRRFGESWYAELEATVQELKNQHII